MDCYWAVMPDPFHSILLKMYQDMGREGKCPALVVVNSNGGRVKKATPTNNRDEVLYYSVHLLPFAVPPEMVLVDWIVVDSYTLLLSTRISREILLRLRRMRITNIIFIIYGFLHSEHTDLITKKVLPYLQPALLLCSEHHGISSWPSHYSHHFLARASLVIAIIIAPVMAHLEANNDLCERNIISH